jgi:O-antigen/teichoic acid export membrane protein
VAMSQFSRIAYKAAADVAAKTVMFVITVAAARRLSPTAFGVFSVASTLGWILAVVSDFGIQMHVARQLARRSGAVSDAGLVHRWLRLRASLAGVAMIALTFVAVVRPPVSARAQILIVAAYLTTGMVEFLHYVYRGLSRTELESSFVVAQRVMMLAAALVVLLVRPSVDLLGVALLVHAIATLVWSYRTLPSVVRLEASRSWPSWHELISDVAPIGIGVVLSAVYFRLDVFLIDRWRGIEAVAHYSAVFRLVDALRLFPAAVLAVVLPALCRARDLKPLAATAASVTALAVALAAALYIVAPGFVPIVYGAAYGVAAPAFRVLLLAFPLMALNYALMNQLIAWDGHRAFGVMCAAAVVVNVAVNWMLIPAQGIVGAAWATLVTEVFLTACCVAALARIRSRQGTAMAVIMAPTAS